MKQTANKNGFTTIELMVSIGIVSILSAAAVPSLISINSRTQLNNATAHIVSNLSSARMSAVSQNVEYQFEVLSSKEYQIGKDDNHNGSIESGEVIVRRNIGNKFHSITISANNTIKFYSRGTASSAAITVANSNHTKTITVTVAGNSEIQ